MSELRYTSFGTKSDFLTDFFTGLTVSKLTMHMLQLENSNGETVSIGGDFLIKNLSHASVIDIDSITFADAKGHEAAKITGIEHWENFPSLGRMVADLVKTADSTVGTIQDDTLSVWGSFSEQSVFGLAGDDRIMVRTVADTPMLDGGLGKDVLDFSELRLPIGMDGKRNQLFVNFGDNSYGLMLKAYNQFSHFDKVIGSRYDDEFDCGDGKSIFFAAGAGDDEVIGGAGNSRFSTGRGNDMVVGGAGKQTMIYGIHSEHDTFGYFEVGTDKIALDGNLGFKNFQQLKEFMTTDNGETIIDFGAGDVLEIITLDDAALTRHDFIF